ncbi:MAG: glycosyltransferase [Anaerolineales bacterium]|nr:glycosyltransferase [Anaerolineales bacterium]
MTEKSVVSVGLVTWNSANRLPDCLNGLHQQNYSNIELIVVDNASADDSVVILNRHYANHVIIQNAENMGYCKAHNQAIRASKGKYYLALNPDVIMDPEYITSMVETLEEHPDCGSAAGKLFQTPVEVTPRLIDTTGLFINRHRRQFLRGHGEEDQAQYDITGEVFGVDGAAPLYRRKMLEDIKIDGQYFDEQFFAHKEDVDLAWRAKLFGWRCWYSPQATAFHPRTFRPSRRKSVSPEIRIPAVKNRYLLMIKNESPATFRRDVLRILSYDMQILVYIILFERSSMVAFRLLLKQLPTARNWRMQIWDRVKARENEILTWFS